MEITVDRKKRQLLFYFFLFALPACFCIETGVPGINPPMALKCLMGWWNICVNNLYNNITPMLLGTWYWNGMLFCIMNTYIHLRLFQKSTMPLCTQYHFTHVSNILEYFWFWILNLQILIWRFQIKLNDNCWRFKVCYCVEDFCRDLGNNIK